MRNRAMWRRNSDRVVHHEPLEGVELTPRGGVSKMYRVLSAIGAVVARFVHTEEVTGSNPVSRTIFALDSVD